MILLTVEPAREDAAVSLARVRRLEAARLGVDEWDVLPLARSVGRAGRRHRGECSDDGEGCDPDRHDGLLLIIDSFWCDQASRWFARIAKSVTAITTTIIPPALAPAVRGLSSRSGRSAAGRHPACRAR
jgi:hypothetical protein